VVINSGSDDRGLLIQDGSTFADARDRTTCTVYDWGNLGNGLHNSESGGEVFFLYRAAIYFNLTSIPAGATIVDATVSVYILTTSFVDNPAQVGMSVCPGESGYPSARPPVAGDYAKAHIAAPADSVTSFSDGTFAEFTIPVEDITPNAWNAFYLRTKGDVDNTAPSGPSAYNQIQLFLGTATDIGNRPMIEIDYTVESPPEPEAWAPTFTSSPDLTGQVGTSYSYEPTCNESVTYSLETKPDWAIMDDGEISGTPLAAGDYDFELKATSDGGGLDTWQNWTVVVPEPVVPPVVDPFSDMNELLASLMTILLLIAVMVAILASIGRW
jgi:hypothetical protein